MTTLRNNEKSAFFESSKPTGRRLKNMRVLRGQKSWKQLSLEGFRLKKLPYESVNSRKKWAKKTCFFNAK